MNDRPLCLYCARRPARRLAFPCDGRAWFCSARCAARCVVAELDAAVKRVAKCDVRPAGEGK